MDTHIEKLSRFNQNTTQTCFFLDISTTLIRFLRAIQLLSWLHAGLGFQTAELFIQLKLFLRRMLGNVCVQADHEIALTAFHR